MIKCELCGKKFVRLRRHLKVAHKMSVSSYNKYFPEALLVDPDYAELNRQRALLSNAQNNLKPIQKGEKRALKKEEMKNEN
jgi:predicted transcriptional regulator